MCATILRNLWLRKNSFLLDNKFPGPKQVVSSALLQLTFYREGNNFTPGQQVVSSANPQGCVIKNWAKPQGKILKCNWDAALNLTTAGLGGIVRDSGGEVLVTLCCRSSSRLKPVVAEASALWTAMFICWELGLADIVFEGDCLQVINAVNDHKTSEDELSPILFDVHYMLRQFSQVGM